MNKPKTREIKAIQFKSYIGYEDVAIYEKSEYNQISHDFKEYQASNTGLYRIITRRIKNDD